MHTVTTDPRSMAQESGLPTGLRSRGLPLWPALTGVCVVLIAAAVLAAGPSDIMAPWDVFILLDGAWRIVVGTGPSHRLRQSDWSAGVLGNCHRYANR